MPPVARYIALRVCQGLAAAFLVVTAIFFLVRLAPGDPAYNIAGTNASAQQIAEIRQQFGLDQSLFEQYRIFLGQLLQGDFGTSYFHHQPAAEVVLERLPYTLMLGATSIALTAVTAVVLGVLSARRAGGWFDGVVSVFTIIGQSMPPFWVALLLIDVFAVRLGLFPVFGHEEAASIVLPTVAASLTQIALVARVTRGEMIKALDSPFIGIGRARGLSERRLMWRHAARNAAIPVVTVLGTQFAAMLNGIVIVEIVFSWPGLGSAVIQALEAGDYPVLQAAVVVAVLLGILATLVVDLLYPLLDPRVRLGEGARA